jgi:hypothetical protein
MREARARELGCRRQGVHDRARVEYPPREDGCLVRDEVGVHAGALRPREPGNRLLLLYRGRDAFERARWLALPRVPRLGLAGLRERAFGEAVAEGIDELVDVFGTLEHALNQLDG